MATQHNLKDRRVGLAFNDCDGNLGRNRGLGTVAEAVHDGDEQPARGRHDHIGVAGDDLTLDRPLNDTIVHSIDWEWGAVHAS
jgi:hypothetical protein